MRFFLKMNLDNEPIQGCSLNTEVFNGILAVRTEFRGYNYYFYALRYENSAPSISEYFYDHPLYENEKYVIIVAGSVYSRLDSSKNKKVIPHFEDILKVITEYRENHYKYLKGNYYILLYDKAQKISTIYASPFFLNPAYVFQKHNTIIFSNHLDFILEHISNPEINARALVEFSLFDHQLHTKTIIKNIFLIPGGYYVILDRRHTPQFTLAYDIAKWLKRNLRPRKESLEAIDDILNKVLRNYSDSVPSFNLSLTGGFDGRLNLALLDTHDYRKMYAFSYGKKGSNQISIPSKIASKLHFMYRPISLDNEFLNSYAEMGYLSILLTSGTTAFNRAVYPYAYKKISEFSKSCILGQCDFIRPLYNNPAGVIFNVFSQAAVLDENYDNFIMEYNKLRERAFINQDYFTKTVADDIYSEIYKLYTEPYKDLSNKERFFFFLYKESIMKYWHTECHLVNLFVDDFITFSDLDYLEELFQSEYCGLYKGLLVKSQLQRRNAHDLYIDLYEINNKKLNFYYNDRYFKPQWLKYGLPGFALAGIGKRIAKFRQKIYGNDTFGGAEWTSLFYLKYQTQIAHNNRFFELNHILNTLAYTDDNDYRKDRHSSLKLWFDIHGLE